jgi:aspartate aminotransferase-like enzyme
MPKKYLLTPGPTPVPSEALLAMARPIIHHRTSQFRKIFEQVNNDLKYIFNTKNDVITFTSSGTGAMEASVSCLLSPGDKAITIEGGKFGERFGLICKAYGIDNIPIKVEYGKTVKPAQIEAELKKSPDIKAVYTTLCETSTGVLSDIKAIGEVVAKTGAVLVVDVISGLGASEYNPDQWKVDVTVGGSQKGLMLPPGLAFISLSKKAWGLVEQSKCPKYYFDLKAAKKSVEKNDTPWTPAVTLVLGLRESLKLMKEEGLDNILTRHKRLAQATRKAVEAIGLEIFSEAPADAVTAVKVPSGVDGVKLVNTMRDEYGVSVAGGQGELKGKIFRIAHLGFMEKFDVITGISCLEIVLSKMGYKFQLGSGIKAAEEEFVK